MRNVLKKFNFITIVVIIGLTFSNCDQPEDSPIDITQSINRFVVEPSPFMGNDKIRYSFKYDEYDFYYIHLGALASVPIFYLDARHFGTTAEMTYRFETERINSTTIRETVSQSSQRALSVVNENTRSKTVGGSLGTEINTKYSMEASVSARFAGVRASAKTGFELGVKVNAETNWNQYAEEKIIGTHSETTSLTNTEEHAFTLTERTMESFTWPLSKAKGDREGWYRYTLFSASDVYLYIIRDAEGVIYYEFIEHLIPGVYGWKLDYNADMNFGKNNETRFEFDITMLDNLPEPEYNLNEPIIPATIVPGSTLEHKFSWLWANSTDDGNYVVEINDNETINPTMLSYIGRDNIIITLTSIGTDVKFINLSSNGSMFTLGSGVTLILGNNIELQGRSTNDNPLIQINNKGHLIMTAGSCVRNNINTSTATTTGGNGGAGGVNINSGGMLTMFGGSITNNTGGIGGPGSGGSNPGTGGFGGTGGVNVNDQGTLIMLNGSIAYNTGGNGGIGGSYNGFTGRGGDGGTGGTGGVSVASGGVISRNGGFIINNNGGSGGSGGFGGSGGTRGSIGSNGENNIQQ